eukprot:TRINITY_DN1227_c0_g10_i1.p2 TRINITY_DN1227_c0_g10~~TRINITY_DN1227_c0_g10_i1.p2  ORF type:complete len:110 (-),score=20.55 TRINITY_DN1227_c0_g10_i1:152-481(-)
MCIRDSIILMESFSRQEGYTRKELNAEEYKRLKASFDALDPEETGSIEAEDLVSLMRSYGIIMNENDLRRMIGTLSLDEEVTRIGSTCLRIRLGSYTKIFREKEENSRR